MKSKSLSSWYYHRWQKYVISMREGGEVKKLPTTVQIIRTGDWILKDERQRIGNEVSAKLGFKLIARKELTDYRYKKLKNHRIKINGKCFVLIPLKEINLTEAQEKKIIG